MNPSLTKCATAALAAIALAACQQPSSDTSPSIEFIASGQTTSSAPVIPASPATSSTAGLPGDHAETRQYKVAINLPRLPAAQQPLADALRATADSAKREFVQALPDSDQDASITDRQYGLWLDFTVAANTSAFTSVRERGGEDTGGAHPIPIEATFVYDRKANRVIALHDLFSHPEAARKALADFARASLLKKLMADAPQPGEGSPAAIKDWKTNTVQMLDEGTKPTMVNFALFMVRAGAAADAASPGLTLVFPPYQVASYAAGTQTVDVPANVFAKFLKPQYQGDFSTE